MTNNETQTTQIHYHIIGPRSNITYANHDDAYYAAIDANELAEGYTEERYTVEECSREGCIIDYEGEGN